ncbi:uncharacterized protein P884DRAFT_274036 [Thermothelomyces heterothallicus CBS 202.75]|uniref:uncharacterized protein n=1 Tax=Thermothelomyces heterothallicus CBS 202.75 TaxID=1149848 RepID=UPI0037439CCF
MFGKVAQGLGCPALLLCQRSSPDLIIFILPFSFCSSTGAGLPRFFLVFSSPSTVTILPLLLLGHLDRRQGEEGDRGDGEGRGRFRFGDDDNNKNGGGRGDDNDGTQRGRGGFFGGGRKSKIEDGNSRGGFGNGNGNGNGRGSKGRNRFGNEDENDRGDGDGNDNGRGNGNDNGSRFGNGRGRGRGFSFGNRFGEGFGRNRNGDSGRDDDAAMTTSSDPETPTSSSSEPTEPPSEESTRAPQPITTTPTDPVPSSEVPSAATTTTTEVPVESNPGVILLQPAITETPTLEANPTVTQFIPLVSPSDAATSRGTPGLGESSDSDVAPSDGPGPSPSPVPTFPSTGGPMDRNGQTGGSGGDGGAGSRLEVAQAGMNPTAERILISASSIGTTRRGGHEKGDGGGLPMRAASSKMSFFRRRGWHNLDQSEIRQSAPLCQQEKTGSASYLSAGSLHSPEKPLAQQPPRRQQQWPQGETNEGVTPPGRDPTYPGIVYHQPPPNTAPGRPQITLMTNIPRAYTHQPQGSFSSTTAAQFGAIVGPAGTASSSPIHSGASAASYYSQRQPLLSQQYNNALYKPPYPQPSWTLSEASSLSSGFGDGDIIVTDPFITVPVPTAQQQQQQQQQQQPRYTTRFSWMTTTTARQSAAAGAGAAGQSAAAPLARNDSSASSAGGGRRETVCTETSEDQPARFRSVASWVDQQKGRIRRAQLRAGGGGPRAAAVATTMIPGDPGIPGVHNPPREQSFDLMMDDGQPPRPVDEVVPGLGKEGGYCDETARSRATLNNDPAEPPTHFQSQCAPPAIAVIIVIIIAQCTSAIQFDYCFAVILKLLQFISLV